MPNIDQALGIHEQALKLRAYRMELISSNLANADTPNYKAKDIDFNSVLSSYKANGAVSNRENMMNATHARHLGGNRGSQGMPDAQYRSSQQPSIDGNTVNSQTEKSAMMENSIHYQATLTFINGKLGTLKKALGVN